MVRDQSLLITLGFQKVGNVIKKGNLVISDNMFANFLLTLLIQLFWLHLDDMSFMLINTLISIAVPGVVQLVLSVLINFIYIDVLFTDYWVPQLFRTTTQSIENKGGLNLYFEENGYTSRFLIKNLGSGFIYLVGYIFMCFVHSILKLLTLMTTK